MKYFVITIIKLNRESRKFITCLANGVRKETILYHELGTIAVSIADIDAVEKLKVNGSITVSSNITSGMEEGYYISYITRIS